MEALSFPQTSQVLFLTAFYFSSLPRFHPSVIFCVSSSSSLLRSLFVLWLQLILLFLCYFSFCFKRLSHRLLPFSFQISIFGAVLLFSSSFSLSFCRFPSLAFLFPVSLNSFLPLMRLLQTFALLCRLSGWRCSAT